MGFWEVVGVIVGSLVALNSAIDAIRGVTLAPVRIWRWLRRAIRAVDVITSIPERLDRVEGITRDLTKVTTAHMRVADEKTQLLDTIATGVADLLPIAQDVHHEVKHNGGSSMKDALARLEAAVADQAQITATLRIPRPAKRGSSPA